MEQEFVWACGEGLERRRRIGTSSHPMTRERRQLVRLRIDQPVRVAPLPLPPAPSRAQRAREMWIGSEEIVRATQSLGLVGSAKTSENGQIIFRVIHGTLGLIGSRPSEPGALTLP